MLPLNKHTESPKIGEGIYLKRDVAEILKLPYHRVNYLMNTYWHGYSFGEKRNKAVNFFALIEFYTYYHLKESGYSSSIIKKFHKQLSKDLKTPYPFASVKVHTPNTKTKKSIMWYEYMGYLMKGDGKQQPAIRDFVEPFLKHIEFGDDSLAKRFYPLKNSKNVVVDPLHQFGQPVINGTNTQTKTLYTLFTAGETKQNISILYDISEKQVTDAINYYSRAA
jgi:uncharacterized protein (DUF433 family)